MSAVVLLFAAWRIVTSPAEATPSPKDLQALAAQPLRVSEVIDVRTLRVAFSNQENLRLRLIGVKLQRDEDASAAIAWLRERVLGREIAVELDRRRLERDGSIPVYAYREGVSLNEELLRTPWCVYDPYPGDSASHAKKLREADRETQR